MDVADNLKKIIDSVRWHHGDDRGRTYEAHNRDLDYIEASVRALLHEKTQGGRKTDQNKESKKKNKTHQK